MPSIRTITIEELDQFGIDESNKLYWGGKPVLIDQKIVLEWWVNLAVIVGAISTFALATVEILRFCGLGYAAS